MSSSIVIENADYAKREQRLIAASELFEAGDLSAAPTDDSFVLRLNTIVARRRQDMEKKIPATLGEGIKADGILKKQAELVVLGRWLLLDGQPGKKKKGGRPTDPWLILQCVATILVEIDMRLRKMSARMHPGGRERRKQEITRHDVAKAWQILFGEQVDPVKFRAPLRSVKLILPRYLEHLKSGHAAYAGKRIRKSPEIQQALKALSGRLPNAQKDRPAILTDPDVKHPATLVPFEIELEYQSPDHKTDYRKPIAATFDVPGLRYIPAGISSTALSGKIRADRTDKIVLKPDVNIRRDYKTGAVIDRLVIIVETSDAIEGRRLQNLIFGRTGASTYVLDLLSRRATDERWGVPFIGPPGIKLAGYPFAIQIQEPTPELLSGILKTIENGPGIEGPILLHLIEVSVDFYSKKHGSPEEAILRREQMVGLLQRHHWVSHDLLVDPASNNPREVDGRQLHDDEEKPSAQELKTRYLFAHEKRHGIKDKVGSDANIAAQSIRDRILTTRRGHPLFLNSTLVKGGKYAPYQISIQHKIADRRDPKKKTKTELPR